MSIRAEAIGSTRGEINVSRTRNNQISIGLDTFDQIAIDYDFVDIERIFSVENNSFRSSSGSHLMNIFKISLSSNENINDAFNALINDSNVVWVEFEGLAVLDNVPTDRVNSQWNEYINLMQLPEMWNSLNDITGRDVILAIVDDGIKWNHEYLQSNIFIDHSQPNIYIDFDTGIIHGPSGYDPEGNYTPDPNLWEPTFWGDAIGWSFRDMTNQSFQSFAQIYPVCPISYSNGSKQHPNGNCFHNNDHGTHVAGISKGIIGHSNIASKIKLLPIRLGSVASLHGTFSSTIGYQGIMYAADKGAHVINCSWSGVGSGNADFANDVVEYATQKGSLVIASAGNNGKILYTHIRQRKDILLMQEMR